MNSPDGPSKARWLGRLSAEFAVIVLGVLVALGVDQWVGDEADRELASFYLEALEVDLRADSVRLELEITRAGRVRLSAERIAEGVESRTANPDPDQLRQDFARMLRVLRIEFNTASIEDLLSSGNSVLIRDSALRRRVISYHISTRDHGELLARSGVKSGRDSYPASVLASPMFLDFRTRLESRDGEGIEYDPLEVLNALRADQGSVLEWLRRVQLNAAYVTGELRLVLEDHTNPLLARLGGNPGQ